MKPQARATQEDGLKLKMTSMIDVVFLLLVFFLVTLQIPRSEGMIEAKLRPVSPDVVQKTTRGTSAMFDDITLRISRSVSGRIVRTLDGLPVRDDHMLLSHLHELRSLHPDGRVVVWCGGDVPYGAVVDSISIVKTAGLKIDFGGLCRG